MWRIPMKRRFLSLLFAVLVFAVFSVLAVVIFRGLDARNRLESQNDGERTINVLLSSLRNYDDFGAAIEAIPSLREKVIGISLFQADRSLLYAWGDAPRTYPPESFTGTEETGRMAEMYVGNPKNSSMVILMRPLRPKDEPPGEPPGNGPRPGNPRESSFMNDTFRKADFISLEIRQPEFWQQKRLQTALLPVVEVLVAIFIGFVWFLIVKNAEYRTNMEKQKNLVMLGTAASTLAHEIKNPLLAIRLQTGILSRVLSGEGRRELSIIDDEVNRLSSLSTRVNDILRDPTGQPQALDSLDIASEVGMHLCGRPLVTCPDGMRAEARLVCIDPERLRSILENLLRNALESGCREEEVAIEISVGGGQVLIDVLDRGAGIPRANREKAFDPFYTTKSRGTGIGLVICRRFALAARGNVTLEDRPGGGTRARITLPRKDA
jgi:two-component system, NtrC family, sensor histidine kinase HydH